MTDERDAVEVKTLLEIINTAEDRLRTLDYKSVKVGDECPYCYEIIEEGHYCNYG